MNFSSMLKTSQSSPLRIAELQAADAPGLIGLTFCPGKKDATSGWDRDLNADLGVIKAWGASVVLTLIEAHEFSLLGVPALGDAVRTAGMEWLHLPIRDVDVPDERFETGWKLCRRDIHERLERGERIVLHCRGGLGRTGLVAGLILVERNIPARDAINRVRAVRPHAIETRAQEMFVINACQSLAA